MQPETHLGMLDQFAAKEVQPLLQKYQEEYQAYSKLKAAVNKNKQMNNNGRSDWICFGTKSMKLQKLI